MRRVIAAITAAVTCVAFAACERAPSHHTTAPQFAFLSRGKGCAAGVMGSCVPPARPLRSLPAVPLASVASARRQIPDVSEYQGCVPPSGPFIYRAWEAGTRAQDTTAYCHSSEAGYKHVWSGAYFFARPWDCVQQTYDAIGVIERLPHQPNVIIVDAEVPLPTGFIKCADSVIARAGYKFVNYTSPGLAESSGAPFQRPLWVADYGVWAPPACVNSVCGRVAWQFTDAATCEGITGDCSYDEGITRLGVRPKLTFRQVALSRIVRLRHRERAHRCGGPWHKRLSRRRGREHRWCRGWQKQKEWWHRRLTQ
jgi:hypothetical protein